MNVRRMVSLGIAGLVILAALFASGCAARQAVFDIRVSEPENPSSGPAVAIVRVTDRRVFKESSGTTSAPSLRGNATPNKAIASRAIGRYANVRDILLPEGRTVEDVVREALVKSFREAGYRVVENPTEQNAEAVPIEADIEQFWTWLAPGFWTLTLQFEAEVRIKGDVPSFKNGETVRGSAAIHVQAAYYPALLLACHKGVASFESEVEKRLAKDVSKTFADGQ